MKRVIVYLALSLLAGCATAAQRQYEAITSNYQVAIQNIEHCTRAVYDSAEFAPLRAHVPSNVNEATLEQLSDASFATDEEIKAILLNHPKFEICRRGFLHSTAEFTPTIAAIFAGVFTREEDALVGLIQKKVSWGGYVTQVREVVAEARVQVAYEGQRITAGLEQSHQAELARRQAAADAFARYNQTQQIINSMNRPVFTNCIGGGAMVNCVTQ